MDSRAKKKKTGNEHTKLQIRRFLDNAIKEAKNPDPKKKLIRKRKEKSKKIAKKYGF